MAGSGIELPAEISTFLADATRGYPFMIQLVGYHVWQIAHGAGAGRIDEEMAREGIALARDRFDRMVIEPALQRLPGTLVEYLLAMAEDGGAPSESGRVAARMGKTPQQVSSYRARLIREDVIEASAWGKVEFAIPYMADYLNAHRSELSAEAAARHT